MSATMTSYPKPNSRQKGTILLFILLINDLDKGQRKGVPPQVVNERHKFILMSLSEVQSLRPLSKGKR